MVDLDIEFERETTRPESKESGGDDRPAFNEKKCCGKHKDSKDCDCVHCRSKKEKQEEERLKPLSKSPYSFVR